MTVAQTRVHSMESESTPSSAHRKRNGAYFTPELVAKCLVSWAIRDADNRLLDPSCGDGRFLANHRHVTGVEHDPSSAIAASKRAPWARVHVDDFFSWAEQTSERFECAAGNPPFIRYQSFSGKMRERALAFCTRLGAKFSGLSSSWAPFLVAAASLLKPRGRMAFVVPAEIGHAPYAVPLLKYLAANFADVRLIAIRESVFPELSQDIWLLYADGFGGSTDSLGFTRWQSFQASKAVPRNELRISLGDWKKGAYRLRRFLLPDSIRQFYDSIANSNESVRLGSVARVGIGYVTGANEFFHLRPSQAKFLGIPNEYLQPSVRNGRILPPRSVTASTVQSWLRRDEAYLLLRLNPNGRLPAAVREYLDSDRGRAAREAYKCRMREPWYSVPDVTIPDGFLSYMSGRGPALVANSAGCACTNSLHAVRLTGDLRFSELQAMWGRPLTQLSAEIEGHPLGGGMLKLEPGEVARIVLPRLMTQFDAAALRAVEEGTNELRRWRHYD